ncbi:MAG TPA: hypothetical protein VN175_00950, partial [Rhizomicrobium sp.]|nr:hypothetical protein [Rhizomicrobium sp.]
MFLKAGNKRTSARMTARCWMFRGGICLAAVALASACATQPAAQPNVPGFAAGLFHGFFAICALLGSLYLHIRVYAFPNSGFWYDAGFVLGFSLNVV